MTFDIQILLKVQQTLWFKGYPYNFPSFQVKLERQSLQMDKFFIYDNETANEAKINFIHISIRDLTYCFRPISFVSNK